MIARPSRTSLRNNMGLTGTYIRHLDFKETMDKAFASASVLARAGTRFRRTSSSVKEEFGLSRMRVFAVHGCKCYKCGLEGTEIIFTVDNGGGRHVDLYANVDGEYTLMNRDHILPASKGGQNHLWNLRPACEKCNSNRGNEYTDEDKASYQHRQLWVRWGKKLFRYTPWLSDRMIYKIAGWLAKTNLLK